MASRLKLLNYPTNSPQPRGRHHKNVRNMKLILLISLFSPLVLAEEDPFAISTKVKEYPARNANSGKTIREQTFRGKAKIRDRTEKDTDGDGIMDFVFDSFWIDGKVVYSTTQNNSECSTGFSSHGDISVVLIESKTDRQVQQIAIVTSKGVLREMFVRHTKGEYEPLSREEFAKAVQASTNILSPLLEFFHDTIEDAKPKELPNKSSLPTGRSSTVTPSTTFPEPAAGL